MREVFQMSNDQLQNMTDAVGPHFSTEADPVENVAAWTEIEEGRFMPRRVRGSNPGRALG
ncbi:MAG: hypothetical protein JNG89_02965 [Planctomycetaceae bacterium]|nr:hypothetical protein [Planctomycetaceae bacterium]